MTERADDAAQPPAPGVRRAALITGAIGVLALVAAVVLYVAGGPPYGVNIGGGALYLLGLLAALTASVLLWIAWSERAGWASPERVRWGVGSASAALLLTAASVVISLSHVAGRAVQLGLMVATAVVLAAALWAVAAGGSRGAAPPDLRRPGARR